MVRRDPSSEASHSGLSKYQCEAIFKYCLPLAIAQSFSPSREREKRKELASCPPMASVSCSLSTKLPRCCALDSLSLDKVLLLYFRSCTSPGWRCGSIRPVRRRPRGSYPALLLLRSDGYVVSPTQFRV